MRVMIPFLAVAALLTGCLTVAPAPKLAPADRDAAAKEFPPAADGANVYVQRKAESLGAGVEFKVLVDGQAAAVLFSDTYQLFTVTPGTHRITVQAGLSSGSVTLQAAAGKTYFYQAGPKAGRAALEPEISLVVLEPMGKLMVRQSRRALELP